MSSKTTNFNLHKIDLNDAPPDITVLNPNWDAIDYALSVLKYGAYIGTEEVLNDYKDTACYTILASANNPFGADEGSLFTVTIDAPKYADGNVSVVQTVTQTYPSGNALPIGSAFKRTYFHAIGWSEWTPVGGGGSISGEGGTISGQLKFQKDDVDGYGAIYKNNSATDDFGTDIYDESADGKTAKLTVDANEDRIEFVNNDNELHFLYGTHNVIKSQTDLTAGVSQLPNDWLYLVYE